MPNKLLLLIEDDYDVAEMLLLYFRSQDYDVLHADNGTDGIELARIRFPHLILLDVMLPDMDGYDVCLNLRRIVMTKYIPILFLTQRDERASKVRGLELGADDYITKPFDIDELRLRVQGSIHRATRENLHELRTGLPTGPMIDEEINRKLSEKSPFVQLVYMLDSFNLFSDMYGFVAANDVLTHAGSMIQNLVSQMGTPNDFVGIIGDELIVLTHTKKVDDLDKAIKKRFADEVRAFYNFMDADQGGIMVDEGKSSQHLVPLMQFKSQKLTPTGVAR